MNVVSTQTKGVFSLAIADLFPAEMPFNLASQTVSPVEAVTVPQNQPDLFAIEATFAPTALDRANEDFRLGAGEMLEPCDEHQDPATGKWYPMRGPGKRVRAGL